MHVRISAHARQKINERGVDTRQVVQAVKAVSDEIKHHRHLDEVKVVVERMSFRAYAPDGSNGEIVVAAVQPSREPVVKTVMYMKKDQVERRSKHEVYLEKKH